jgi:signal transduction histidine kinase
VDPDIKHLQDPNFATAMLSMVRTGSDCKSPSDVAWQVCDSIQNGLCLDDIILYLMNDDSTELIQAAAAGPKKSPDRNISNPIRIPVGHGIVGSVAETGHAEIIDDTSVDGRYILDDAHRLSEISVPIIQSGRLIGVLDSETDPKGYYTSDHLARLELMASVASPHILRVMAEINLENVSRRKNQLEQIAAQQTQVKEQLNAMETWLSRESINLTQTLHHELRTPLNAIMGISEILDDICNRGDPSEKELIPFASMLKRSGQDLLDRITDLLEVPRLSGNDRLSSTGLQEVDVALLLGKIHSRLTHNAEKSEMQIELDVQASGAALACDPVALSRVICYLIDNATKFSSNAAVLVRLVVDESGKPQEIAVIDQGIGIERAQIDRIFEPFLQLDQGLTRRYGGLGLGLPIARRLCRDMGFTLAVDSHPGRGSCFSVKFC